MLARRGGGGLGVARVRYFVSGFWRELQKFKNFCDLRPQSKGGPLPVSGRFAAEGHSIQCLSGPVEGGGVHVASYMLVLQRSGQGGAVCT